LKELIRKKIAMPTLPTAPNRQEIRKLVVIAASAGGIGVLQELLSRLPRDLPMAVVIVQHLAADRKTRLPQYLAQKTGWRVCLAVEAMPLETGVAYLAEPGKHLRVEDGHLVLGLEAPLHYLRPAADILFASAAQAFGPEVLGVVLSGTGRDGAQGCQAIKARGGVTMAQNKQSSPYYDMPRAAIEAEAIDYVLPIREMAKKIESLIREAKSLPESKEMGEE
jgi:two-component system chemotaxis response regulator CheB